MSSIAPNRQFLEASSGSSTGDFSPSSAPQESEGHLRAARIRLFVAIPAAMVIWTLAAGVIGVQLLQSLAFSVEEEILTRTVVVMVSALLAISALAALTGLAIARSVQRPIAQINERLNALLAGKRPQAVPVGVNDEIGQLSVKFNSMLRSLEERVQERSQFIMDQFAGALITTDAEGRVTRINQTACALLETENQTVLGLPVSALIPEADGANCALAREIGGIVNCAHEVRNRSRTLHRGDNSDIEVLLSVSAERDQNDEVRSLVFNLRDLGRIRAFHDRMKRQDQLVAVSTFASGVAHEIRNPLAAIKGIAQLLEEDRSEDARMARFARIVVSEVNRLDRIVTELQAFTVASAGGGRRCAVQDLVREALNLVRDRLEADSLVDSPVSIDCEEAGEIVGSSERLLQALFHILHNAFEASAGLGEVWVRARPTHGTGSVVIEIENSGSSIPPEAREQIFTPFFTTKAAGPGLGLAVARQIINQHQGEIVSRSGDGNVTFEITLPRAPSNGDGAADSGGD